MNDTIPQQTIEPRFLPDNFSVWEELYGKTLSDEEKDEISLNTRLFFNLLLAELSSKKGKNYVYKRIDK